MVTEREVKKEHSADEEEKGVKEVDDRKLKRR